jgi:hypothetical protein
MKKELTIRTVSGLVAAIRQTLPRMRTGAMSYKALRRAINDACTEHQWAVAMHALTRDAEITLVGDHVSIINIPYGSRADRNAIAIHDNLHW